MKILETPVVQTVCNAAKTVYKTLKSEFSILLFAGTGIVKGVQGIGLVALDSSLVKNALAIGGLVKASLEAVATVPDLYEVAKLKNRLFEVSSRPPEMLEFIKKNHKQMRAVLGIAKEAGLLDRAERALSTEAKQEDREQFLQSLRKRVNVKFGVALAKVVSRLTNIAASIILLVLPPNPATLIVIGGCGLATLGIWAFEKVFLPKNPFDAPKEAWYNAIPQKIRTTAFRVGDAINTLFHPQVKPVAV